VRYPEPYGPDVERRLNSFRKGLAADISSIITLPEPLAVEVLRFALGLACECQNSQNILLGRAFFAEIPRAWLLDHRDALMRFANEFHDAAWEFRRLLELVEPLDIDLHRKIVSIGNASANDEVREAATDSAKP
jgi:hypothetical protein